LVTHARESSIIDELQTIELEINWKANWGGGGGGGGGGSWSRAF
jgi:hypothetical protein